jgi:dihydrofolate synthase / folylpolyglutamate synthase
VSGTPSPHRPPDPTALAYHEALQALAERGRFGIRLGLGRTRALLAGLGDPQRSVRGALVAGTNGKGSVIALAASALRAAGYRVGETPKPHLVSYRERIVVDGRPIDPGAFARLVAEVLPLADRVARRHGEPTEFELLTAVMFRHFADVAPDLVLVEVGLGGRLDATHAWDGGVAVVTNVDLDHMDRLGPTVVAIAREKAAIIERGDVAVTGATGEALAVIRRRARRMGAPLRIVDAPPILGWDRDGMDVALDGLGRVRIGLRGRHQAGNAAVANALLDALAEAGIALVPSDARRRGFANARWAGRLELLDVPHPGGGTVEVLLDGAHNPAGAAALAQALDDLRPHLRGSRDGQPAPITLVWASMADKDVAGTLTAVAAADAIRGAEVVCTAVVAPRAMEPGVLAAAWRSAAPDARISVVADPAVAFERAIATAPGPVVVAGSLYLVGLARARLVDDPLLRDPAPGAA